MFQNCSSLEDFALDDILNALMYIPDDYNIKTLAHLGLSSSQADYCVSTPTWEELEELGWTTGY